MPKSPEGKHNKLLVSVIAAFALSFAANARDCGADEPGEKSKKSDKQVVITPDSLS